MESQNHLVLTLGEVIVLKNKLDAEGKKALEDANERILVLEGRNNLKQEKDNVSKNVKSKSSSEDTLIKSNLIGGREGHVNNNNNDNNNNNNNNSNTTENRNLRQTETMDKARGFRSWNPFSNIRSAVSKEKPNLSWMETTDKANGFREWKPFPNIRFAVSKENPLAKYWSNMKFDCPLGFHFCSTQEFLDEIGNSDENVEYPYYGQEGWDGSTWNGKSRIVFLFSDSQKTGKFKHAYSSKPKERI